MGLKGDKTDGLKAQKCTVVISALVEQAFLLHHSEHRLKTDAELARLVVARLIREELAHLKWMLLLGVDTYLETNTLNIVKQENRDVTDLINMYYIYYLGEKVIMEYSFISFRAYVIFHIRMVLLSRLMAQT